MPSTLLPVILFCSFGFNETDKMGGEAPITLTKEWKQASKEYDRLENIGALSRHKIGQPLEHHHITVSDRRGE